MRVWDRRQHIVVMLGHGRALQVDLGVVQNHAHCPHTPGTSLLVSGTLAFAMWAKAWQMPVPRGWLPGLRHRHERNMLGQEEEQRHTWTGACAVPSWDPQECRSINPCCYRSSDFCGGCTVLLRP